MKRSGKAQRATIEEIDHKVKDEMGILIVKAWIEGSTNEDRLPSLNHYIWCIQASACFRGTRQTGKKTNRIHEV